jgi:hypothetical protein
MSTFNSIVYSGAAMTTNAFNSGVDSNKCALNYESSSFSGGKKVKKLKQVSNPKKLKNSSVPIPKQKVPKKK